MILLAGQALLFILFATALGAFAWSTQRGGHRLGQHVATAIAALIVITFLVSLARGDFLSIHDLGDDDSGQSAGCAAARAC